MGINVGTYKICIIIMFCENNTANGSIAIGNLPWVASHRVCAQPVCDWSWSEWCRGVALLLYNGQVYKFLFCGQALHHAPKESRNAEAWRLEWRLRREDCFSGEKAMKQGVKVSKVNFYQCLLTQLDFLAIDYGKT